MNYIVLGLSIFVFIKTLGYAMFEQKEKNIFASIIIYILAFICLIAPNIVMKFV